MNAPAPPARTVDELARAVGGRVRGRGDLRIAGVNALDDASPAELTFLADAAHARRWATSRAGAAVVSRGLDVPGHDPDARALIEVDRAEVALASILEMFRPHDLPPPKGVHPSAVVHPDAELGDGVSVGPHAAVEAGCRLGERVILRAGVRLGRDVTIGAESILHENVVVRERCEIGRGVILHAGAVIGSEGFGYRPGPDGNLVRMPHLGTVRIEDDVEIGANACVDRGKFGPTVVGRGSKIDNLVQIAHNCVIGERSVIAGLTALAGSVRVGNGVQIGGLSGVKEGVRIGDGARIGGGSGVMRDVRAGEAMFGYPAEPLRESLRQFAALRKLPTWMREIGSRVRAGDRADGGTGHAPANPGRSTPRDPDAADKR